MIGGDSAVFKNRKLPADLLQVWVADRAGPLYMPSMQLKRDEYRLITRFGH